MQFWLMKSEPHVFSIDDLVAKPNRVADWHGVRNYQARNLLRDTIGVGDQSLFYHSSCPQPAVVGLIKIIRGGYPDATAWDPASDYFDPKSSPENPRWYRVDVKLVKKLKRPVLLSELRTHSELESLALLKRGNRLSIQPVTPTEFAFITTLA